MAYLNYYVAEMVCETSGVLATVALGVMTKFVGRPMINDPKLLEDFWTCTLFFRYRAVVEK